MEYQNFLRAVKEELNRKFDKRARARSYETVRNNGTHRRGVVIESEDSNLCPAIYLEGFYERCQKGLSVEAAVLEIMEFYQSVKVKGYFDIFEFRDFGAVRDRIVIKLINYEKNLEMLKEIPHKKILDLALVFCVLFNQAEGWTAAVTVRGEHLRAWGTDEEEILRLAMDNTKKLLPARFYPMRQALKEFAKEISGVPPDFEGECRGHEDMMYVLTNTYKNFGAACMAYPEVLEAAGNILGEDFYILPSSIHELIIVPASKGISPPAFNEIIGEINETQMDPEEILSGHCYYFSMAEKELTSPA